MVHKLWVKSSLLYHFTCTVYDTESCCGRQRESMNIMIWSEFALSQQCNFAFFIRIYQSFTADWLLYFSMSIIYVIVSRFKAICMNVVFLDSLPMSKLHCGYRELNRRIWTNLTLWPKFSTSIQRRLFLWIVLGCNRYNWTKVQSCQPPVRNICLDHIKQLTTK